MKCFVCLLTIPFTLLVSIVNAQDNSVLNGAVQIKTNTNNINYLSLGTSTSNTDIMNITGDGLVGIGLHTPTVPLDIRKSSSGDLLRLSTDDNNLIGTLSYNASLSTVDLNVAGYGTPSLTFHTDANERMRIDRLGNVGIGTTTPGARLHIFGGTGLLVENGPMNAKTSSGSPDANIDNPDVSVMGANGLLSNDGGLYYWRAFWGQSIDLRAGNIADAQRNIFRIRRYDGNSSWTELMRVSENGNVGIGAVSDNYKLTVNGAIGAQKVKVTQNVWADFVFHPDYQLPSLKALDQYIANNKHLPDMPTEADVKSNGVDVGDTQAKLLQKIEELTLYVIQLNKKIEEQQEQINEMKSTGKK
jgi:hypothetical protein